MNPTFIIHWTNWFDCCATNWIRLEKWGSCACKLFNTFVDEFRRKFLMLVDDVEQFFLWDVATALDRGKLGFDWLRSMWDNKADWPNVATRFNTLNKFVAEVETTSQNR